jgi:hypothetical protein
MVPVPVPTFEKVIVPVPVPTFEKLRFRSVFRIRIRIHRIHMFLGILDPDPLVRGMDPDPDPSIVVQK